MAARDEHIPFTRAHQLQLEEELNASRILHQQMRDQIIAQQTVLQQQSDAIGAITTQLGAMAVGPGATPRYNIKFDTFAFDGVDPQAEFDRFEQNVKMVATVMKYKVPEVCSAILGQMRGKAADIARSLIGTEDEYRDLDEFMHRLRSLFVSPAYQEKARSAFLARIQKPRENIIAYHGVLKTLFEKAYQGTERNEITLIRQFIAGLRNAQINERLHLDQPRSYQDALDRALYLEGTYEVIAIEAKRREQNGQTPAPTHPLPIGRGDVMDIGALGHRSGTRPAYRGNRGNKRPTFNTQRGRFVQANKRTFGSNQIRGSPPQNRYRTTPARGNYNSYRGYARSFGNNRSPNWKPRTPKPQATDGCYVCGDKGHWAKESPNKQSLQTPAGVNTTNYVAPRNPMPATRPSAPGTAPKQVVPSRRPPKPNSAMALNYAGGPTRYVVDSDSDSKNGKVWMQQ